jgi:hypothetical protein
MRVAVLLGSLLGSVVLMASNVAASGVLPFEELSLYWEQQPTEISPDPNQPLLPCQSGYVVARYTVGSTGSISGISAIEATLDAPHQLEAMRFLAQSRFMPTPDNRDRRPITTQQRVEFSCG